MELPNMYAWIRRFCKYCNNNILTLLQHLLFGISGRSISCWNGVEIFNVLLLLATLQLLKRACCRFNAVAITHAVVCRDNTHCCSPNYGGAGRWWRDRFKRFVRVLFDFTLSWLTYITQKMRHFFQLSS